MLRQHYDVYQPDRVGAFSSYVPSDRDVTIQHDDARVATVTKTLALHLVLRFEQRRANVFRPRPDCQLFGKRFENQRAQEGFVVRSLRAIREPHETVTVSSQCGSSPTSWRLKSVVSLNSITADTPSKSTRDEVGLLRNTTTSHI